MAALMCMSEGTMYPQPTKPAAALLRDQVEEGGRREDEEEGAAYVGDRLLRHILTKVPPAQHGDAGGHPVAAHRALSYAKTLLKALGKLYL